MAKSWIYYDKASWQLWQEGSAPIPLQNDKIKSLTDAALILGPEQTRFLTAYFPKVSPSEQKGLLTLAVEQAKDWSGDFNFISEVIEETPQKQLITILYTPQDAIKEAQKILQKIGVKSPNITSIYQQLIFNGSGIVLYWYHHQLIITLSQKGKLFYGAHFPDVATAEAAYDCSRKTIAALLRQFENLQFQHYYFKAPELSSEAEERFCRQLQYFSQLSWQRADNNLQTALSSWQNGFGQKQKPKKQLPFFAKIAVLSLILCTLVDLSAFIYHHHLEKQKHNSPAPATILSDDKDTWQYSNCLNAISTALGETITLYEITVSGQEMTLYASAHDLLTVAAFGRELSASPHFLEAVITMTETLTILQEEKQQLVNFTMNLTLKRQERTS